MARLRPGPLARPSRRDEASAEIRRSLGEAETATLDEETLRSLRALGYVE